MQAPAEFGSHRPEDLGVPIRYLDLKFGNEYYFLNLTTMQFRKVVITSIDIDVGVFHLMGKEARRRFIPERPDEIWARNTETDEEYKLIIRRGNTSEQRYKFFTIRNPILSRRIHLLHKYNANKHLPRTMGGRRRRKNRSRK